MALLICTTSVEAGRVLYKFQLRAVLNDAVVKSLEQSNGTELLVGAVSKPVPDARWWSRALGIRRFRYSRAHW